MLVKMVTSCCLNLMSNGKNKKSFIERIKPTGAKDLIRKIILLVCICVFCYSAYNLASIFLEYKSMDDSNKEVEETYVTENTEQKNYI